MNANKNPDVGVTLQLAIENELDRNPRELVRMALEELIAQFEDGETSRDHVVSSLNEILARFESRKSIDQELVRCMLLRVRHRVQNS